MPSVVTSPYGMRQRPSGPHWHGGVDISGPEGRPVYALLPGVVTHATGNGDTPGFCDYGSTVVIRHDNPRVWTMHAHLLDTAVVPGQRVTRGTPIGRIGRTRGCYNRETRTAVPAWFHTSGSHLHFEVRTRSLPADYGDGAIDPELWLASQGLPLPTSPWSGGLVARSSQPAPVAAPGYVVATQPVPAPPARIARALENASRERGVPLSVLQAVAYAESRYNANAVSPAGAQGLMQLMPETAEALGVTRPFDPAQSARGGATFLKQLYDKHGSWVTALAAYNWGPGNVNRNPHPTQWPGSTQRYIASILAPLPSWTPTPTPTPTAAPAPAWAPPAAPPYVPSWSYAAPTLPKRADAAPILVLLLGGLGLTLAAAAGANVKGRPWNTGKGALRT